MPRATEEQRSAFAEALFESMRKPALALPAATRLDEWLAEQVGLSSQAIRNYLSALREPKNAEIVASIEDALGVPRHHLGRHLGYGPSASQRLDVLEARVESMSVQLQQALELLQEVARPVPRVRRRRPPSDPIEG